MLNTIAVPEEDKNGESNDILESLEESLLGKKVSKQHNFCLLI